MRKRRPEMEPELRTLRPDVLGGTLAWHGDGGNFTQVMYFTSAAEAHKNEQAMAKSPFFQEFMAQLDGDLTFYDLTEPDFESGSA